ncbi:BCCT family transporter [Natranaerobius thermophilus]|uniref:Choline/carnitine/betaine transporter n=1 Tax=Natranaerobius thermophilus (strain ATCC BAA-1301 / DSM 18059 / JW/NM-WN-LF) TaxID=457570 RepID=B2A0M9_NATTJ|nr:BCCT family transporter [Natranaerobius thermophilus]ACB84587.1 choline/carnitine/betaine transporter [Natranaerobius thermophilus JW/NM-WN-LF]
MAANDNRRNRNEDQEIDRDKIEELLFSRNTKKFGFDLNPVVSLGAGIIIIIFSAFALINLERANILVNSVNEIIVTNFDWIFILSSSFFILICIYIAFSKLGKVKIGGLNAEREFSNFAWYSMLISAGMGIGLMFWAVGEPLTHFEVLPPVFDSPFDKHTAMATTFFHWGLHPWAVYSLIALALAFFAYNKHLPLSIRSVFYPFFKERVYGTLGDVIDTLAVLSTLFGLATSLGLGAQQINSGLDYLFDIGFSVNIQVALIIGITLLATISVLSGIDKGVKFLSKMNIRLAAILMGIILLLGPTGFILRLFSNSLGLYFNNIIEYSFFIAVEETGWQANWSIFYLAWWISWSPFVGMFIARISKGRTIRELILGVMIVPSLLSFLWLSVFGGSAIFINEQVGGLYEVVQDDLPVALYELVNLLNLPLLAELFRILLFILITFLVAVYFITSSDSGSLVVNKITSSGKLNTPANQRAFWAILEGLLAAVLLLIGGEKALLALQTAVISTGLPFAVVLTAMAFALIKGIEDTRREQKRKRERRKFEKLLKAHDQE